MFEKALDVAAARRRVNGIAANGCFHLLLGGEGNPEHPYGIYPDHDYYKPGTDRRHRLGICR